MSSHNRTSELETSPQSQPQIPILIKVAYTAFIAVLVPYYWYAYGPTNFLFFCDIALFITLAAIWKESSLLASMAGVGILLPQAIWMADFLGSMAGVPLTNMTAYMFDSKYSLFVRGLSFFHFWLPILIVFLIWRLGYDARAFKNWTYLAWTVLFICFFFMPAPPAPADTPDLIVNINYVHGFSNKEPQSLLPPFAWFGGLLVVLPVAIYLPTHLALKRFFKSN